MLSSVKQVLVLVLVLVEVRILVKIVQVSVPILVQIPVLVQVFSSVNLVEDEVRINAASPLVDAVDVRPWRLDAVLALWPLTVVVRLR